MISEETMLSGNPVTAPPGALATGFTSGSKVRRKAVRIANDGLDSLDIPDGRPENDMNQVVESPLRKCDCSDWTDCFFAGESNAACSVPHP